MNNQINQSSTGSGDNIAGNKIVNNNSPKHIVPCQLTSSPRSANFIGRKKELEEIETLLDSSNTLLVKGIGGVGKSTLSKYYLHSQKSQFDYYGFFEGIERFAEKLKVTLNLQQEKDEECFMEALLQLQSLKGKKLLIIDNIENINDNEKKLEQILGLEEYGYKILLTSRFRVKNIKTLSLKSLTPEDGLVLFTNYYKTEEIDKVSQIMEYLDYHALLVELVAKTIDNEDYSLDEIIEKFELGELSKIEFIDEDNGEETSFKQNLEELFGMQKKSLKDEYILLLKQLAILPSIDIELRFLEEIFSKKLKSRLNFLVSQGWLIGNDTSYKLHQIIKEYIFSNHKPAFEEIEFQVDFFLQLMNLDDINILSKNRDNIIFFESLGDKLDILDLEHLKIIYFFLALGKFYHYSLGNYIDAEYFAMLAAIMSKSIVGEESFLAAEAYSNTASAAISRGELGESTECFLQWSIEIKEKIYETTNEKNTLSSSYSHLGTFYQKKGNAKKAELFYIKALKLDQKLSADEDTATLSINLAENYRLLADYDKAEPLYLNALDIKKKLLGELHPDIAIIYNNLGLLYTAKENHKEAEVLYKKSLDILKNTWGEEHPHVGVAYHNLAFFYENIKNYSKAEDYYLISLEIMKKRSGLNDSSIADSYSNLSRIYSKINMLEKAEVMNEKALKIRQKLYGKKHPDIATSYTNKANLYFVRKNYEKAYEYIKRAVDIGKEVLPSNHPNLISFQRDMKIIEMELLRNKLGNDAQDYFSEASADYSKKISRNSPCLCNSGLKYKKCCGKN